MLDMLFIEPIPMTRWHWPVGRGQELRRSQWRAKGLRRRATTSAPTAACWQYAVSEDLRVLALMVAQGLYAAPRPPGLEHGCTLRQRVRRTPKRGYRFGVSSLPVVSHVTIQRALLDRLERVPRGPRSLVKCRSLRRVRQEGRFAGKGCGGA